MRSQFPEQMSVALHPLNIDPTNPGGQVAGWQHVPSCMQVSPLGHVRQVMAGMPQAGDTGLHDGVFSSSHVLGVQHVPS
jgi:hypothetical protein